MRPRRWALSRINTVEFLLQGLLQFFIQQLRSLPDGREQVADLMLQPTSRPMTPVFRALLVCSSCMSCRYSRHRARRPG